MKKLLLLTLSCCLSMMLYAQNATLQGTVQDALSGETLIQANIRFGERGTTTNIDGFYSIELPPATYQMDISYIGYKTQQIEVTLTADEKQTLNINLSEDNLALKEIEIVADVALTRSTPIAFSNIGGHRLAQEIGVQELPTVLNHTPGIYATSQGGGRGDARINIRGFNQRNVAVLIDGVPINDMENGQVFWSNWQGLADAIRSVQVQRGLGAAKLALPSIGGTINVLTKGIDSKRSVSLRQSIGNNGFLKTTISGTTGRLPKGWGVTFTGSYEQGNGWVDNTWFKGWNYFLKVEKELGKHLIGLSVMGAPQEHAQRSFKKTINTYDKEYARNYFNGTTEEYDFLVQNNTALSSLLANYNTDLERQGRTDEVESQFQENLDALGINDELLELYQTSFIDTSGARNYGIRYNEHWGLLQRAGQEEKVLTERVNFYHKPQIMLKDFWTINSKLSLSNIAYLSIGKGGGSANDGGGLSPIDTTGQLNYQNVYNFQANPLFPDSTGLNPSTNIIRNSINEHIWYGLLSTINYTTLGGRLSLSSGIDLRNYKGIHFREIRDLLGGDYFGRLDSRLVVGDKLLERNYDGFVKWGGLFTQLKYTEDKWSAFFSSSVALTNYKAVDNITGAEATPDNIWGGTVKLGFNYNINEYHNIFAYGGYLNKAPLLSNVINVNDEEKSLYGNTTNEIIWGGEVGYNISSAKFSLKTNAYYTKWQNRPLNIGIMTNDGMVERVNVSGIGADHRGVELEFAYEVIPQLEIEGLLSIGDWIWKTDSSAVIDASQVEGLGREIDFSANGVHVGDAAQYQVGASLRAEPIKGAYVTLKWIYFAKLFADFNPDRLTGRFADQESWRIPNYQLFSLSGGYKFNIKKQQASVGFTINNLLNTRYVADASTRNGFDPNLIEVFFGQGRRFSTNFKVTF